MPTYTHKMLSAACGLILLLGATAVPPLQAMADPVVYTQAPQGATSIPGETFTIDVAVRNNAADPIMGYSFRVSYDWRVFELVEVDDLELGGYPPRLSAVERDGDKAWRLVSATGNMQNRDPNPTLCRLTFRRSYTALDPVSITLEPSPNQISLTTVKFQGLRCRFDSSATQSRTARQSRPATTAASPTPRTTTAPARPATPTPRPGAAASRPDNYYQSQEWYDVIFNQPPRTAPVAPFSAQTTTGQPLPPTAAAPAPPPPPPVADMDDLTYWSGGEDFITSPDGDMTASAMAPAVQAPATAHREDYPTDRAVVRLANMQETGFGAQRQITLDLVVENNTQAPVLSYAFRVSYNGADWTLDRVEDLGLGGEAPTLGEPLSMLNRESRLVSASGPDDGAQNDLALCRLVFMPRPDSAMGDLAPRLQDHAQGISLAGTHHQAIDHLCLPTPEASQWDSALPFAPSITDIAPGGAAEMLGHSSAMIFITNNQGDPYQPGERLTLDVAVLYNAQAPVRSYQMRVNYHPDAVEPLHAEAIEDGLADPILSDEQQDGALAWRTIQATSPNNTMQNFTLFRMTFQVKESVPLLHSITLSDAPDSAATLVGSDGAPIPHVFDNSAADPLLPPAPTPES